MKIFTIGFTQKTAEQFFGLLRTNQIERIVDIRLRPEGQLAGFAKKDDLAYFLRELANGCQYIHLPELAPTSDILDEYRKDKNWTRYLLQFHALMDERNIPDALNWKDFETSSALLCSEATPEYCHRRLVAERMAAAWPGVEIVHL